MDRVRLDATDVRDAETPVLLVVLDALVVGVIALLLVQRNAPQDVVLLVRDAQGIVLQHVADLVRRLVVDLVPDTVMEVVLVVEAAALLDALVLVRAAMDAQVAVVEDVVLDVKVVQEVAGLVVVDALLVQLVVALHVLRDVLLVHLLAALHVRVVVLLTVLKHAEQKVRLMPVAERVRETAMAALALALKLVQDALDVQAHAMVALDAVQVVHLDVMGAPDVRDAMDVA